MIQRYHSLGFFDVSKFILNLNNLAALPRKIVLTEERNHIDPGRSQRIKYNLSFSPVRGIYCPINMPEPNFGNLFLDSHYNNGDEESGSSQRLILTTKRSIPLDEGIELGPSRIKIFTSSGYFSFPKEENITRADHIRPLPHWLGRMANMRPFNRVGWVETDLSAIVPTDWFLQQYCSNHAAA